MTEVVDGARPRVGRRGALLQVVSDPLHRTSLLLMLNMGLVSALGFVFWAIAARRFEPSSIGIVTATTSLSVFFNTLGSLGMTNALVRFLVRRPASSRRLFVDAVVLSQCVGLLVLAVLWMTPLKPALVTSEHPWASSLLVVVFVQAGCLSMLTDSALLAYQRASTIVIKNAAGSAVKLAALAVPFTWASQSIHLMAIQVLGMLVATCIAVRPLFRRHLSAENRSHRAALTGIWSFSMGNYAGLVLGIVPLSITPVLVLRNLGEAQTAYFSVCLMLTGLLNVISSSVGQSLFAEAQRDEAPQALLTKSVRSLVVLLVPAVLVGVVLAPVGLAFFGTPYVDNATPLLRLMVVAALASAVGYVGDSLVNSRADMRAYIFLNLQSAALVVVGVLVGAQWGLVEVGVGWLAAQVVGSLVSIACVLATGAHRDDPRSPDRVVLTSDRGGR